MNTLPPSLASRLSPQLTEEYDAKNYIKRLAQCMNAPATSSSGGGGGSLLDAARGKAKKPKRRVGEVLDIFKDTDTSHVQVQSHYTPHKRDCTRCLLTPQVQSHCSPHKRLHSLPVQITRRFPSLPVHITRRLPLLPFQMTRGLPSLPSNVTRDYKGTALPPF